MRSPVMSPAKSPTRSQFRAASGIACLLLAAGTASSLDFGVKIDVDLNGFVNGIISADSVVAPDTGLMPATGSGRLVIKPSLGEAFGALIAVEGWAGKGYDQQTELTTLEPVNSDIVIKSPFLVSEAYVSATLGQDSTLTISAGKVDVSGLFDVSDVAGDQRTQFLNLGFRNSSCIIYPGDTDAPRSVGAWFNFEAASRKFACTAGWAGMDTDLSDPYFFGEGRVGLGGNMTIGAYIWQASNALRDWTPALRDSVIGYGAFADYEPPMTGNLKLFARLSFADETMRKYKTSWSLGTRVGGSLWGRANDSVGVAFGSNLLSDDYAASFFPPLDADEGVLEGYYRFMLLTADSVTHRPSLEITPNVQWIFNPGGDSLNADALIWGLRLRSVMRF